MSNPNEKNQFSMPGPQFNSKGPVDLSWLKKNSQKITMGVILLLLAVGSFYFYKSYQERTALLKPAVNDIRASIEKTAIPPAELAKATSQVKGAEITRTEPEAIRANGKIIVSPAKGNGVTHLARQALKEYLKDNPELAKGLKAEHKIYIEDYLRKNLADAPEALQMNDTLSFPQELIQDAISQAQQLTDSQLNNLQKYVPLVPSLNY